MAQLEHIEAIEKRLRARRISDNPVAVLCERGGRVTMTAWPCMPDNAADHERQYEVEAEANSRRLLLPDSVVLDNPGMPLNGGEYGE